jgi:murein L,D-transpeptidase YafK
VDCSYICNIKSNRMKTLKTLLTCLVFMSFSYLPQISGSPRVKDAYSKKWNSLKNLISSKGVNPLDFECYLRAFKLEGKFEVWVRDRKSPSSEFILLKTYDICKSSGTLGPKRKEGDGQVPEGFYNISSYNPNSKYHLGMLVNYPNNSDLIRSNHSRPGGQIMVHGDCVTIGCIPLTDEYIEEVYILSLESSNKGKKVRIDIFPCHFNKENIKNLSKFPKQTQEFWNELRPAYDKFNRDKKLYNFTVNPNGSYLVK